MKARLLIVLQAAVIVAAAWWIYAPALHGEWLWDDNTNITENPLMRDPAALWKIWFAPTSLDYYPLQMTVEWAQWRLWGMDTLGYHATNVVLDVACAFLLWRVLRKLGLRLAWLGGLLLVVHPVTVESVAWIVEVKNTMSLAFLLLAYASWLDYRGRRDGVMSQLLDSRSELRSWDMTPYLLSLGFFVAAMLSKASVVMFPFVLLLHAWWKTGRVSRRDAVETAPFLVVSLALGLVAVLLQQHRAIGAVALPLGGPLSRAAVAGLGAAFYLWKFLVPAGLMPIYPRWDVDPPSALQFLPWLAIGGLAWFLWRTRRRGALFCLAVFLVNLAPVSGIISVSYMRLTWVMDHLAYVSFVGLIGLAVAAADRAQARFRVASIVLFAALAAVLAAQSRACAGAFATARVYWTRALAGNPGAWAAHYNLALILVQSGEFPEAIAHLERAVALNTAYEAAENNLANALSQTGRYDEAVPHYESALRLNPGNAVTHYDYGLTLRSLGRSDEARDQVTEAARLGFFDRQPGK